jgi:hypothetical protein
MGHVVDVDFYGTVCHAPSLLSEGVLWSSYLSGVLVSE